MSGRTLPSRGVWGCLLLLCAASAACDDDTQDEPSAAESQSKAGAGGQAASRDERENKDNGGSGGSSDSTAPSSAKSETAADGGKGGSSSARDGEDNGREPGPAKPAQAEAEAEGGKGGAGGAAAGSGGSGGAAGPSKVMPRDLSNITATKLDKLNALNSLVFAPNGKIYAAGEVNVIDEAKASGDTAAEKYKSSTVGHKLVVARFNADGEPDPSFGDSGFVTWEGPAGEAASYALTLSAGASEEVIVAANVKYASKRGGVALVKFDSSGKLVESFGDKGRKDLILGWNDDQVADFPATADGTPAFPNAQSWDIQTAADGDLVVFLHESAAHGKLDDSKDPPLQRSDNDRYIVRVNADDGEIDATWNSGKPVVVNTPNEGATGMSPRYPSDGGRRGLIEPDGSIVSVGYTNYNDDKGNHIVMIRVKPDGSFDEQFHKERAIQPQLPGVAVFNPVPEQDKGFAEAYGVVKTDKGYVTSGYGRAYGVAMANGMSSLGYLPSVAVDMVATRFTGTEVDTSYGKGGLLAAQSESLGADAIETFEDRGRSAVVALPDKRVLMGGRFGDYPALFVVTEDGALDTRIAGKRKETEGMLLFPRLQSDKQPATSMVYGIAAAQDGKRVAIGTNNHEQGAYLSVLRVEDDGKLVPVKE